MSKNIELNGRLIVERQSPALRERLWQVIEQAKGDDVLAPVTVVGPSRYANLSLRHELGRRGFANVRFIVLPVLSEMLGAAILAQTGRKPFTAVLEGVAVRAGLSEATGPLASVSLHPATQASARSSFRELRRAPTGMIEALEQQGGVRSEVVRLYRRFRQATIGEWYDAEDLAEAAAETVLKGHTPVLEELGLIVFYLPSDVTTGETRLVEALASQGRCAVLLGTTGDEGADGPALALHSTLWQLFPGPWALMEDHKSSPLPPGDVALHIAPSAHEELRWVIRQIVAEATERKTPLHRMAILYRAESLYGSLIPDELRLAGIPIAGPGRETMADTGPGRTLLGLLTLADGEFRRADVMTWLTGCPVSPPTGRSPGFNPSHWDSLSRRAGIVGGLGQWRDHLDRYARDLEQNADRRLNKGEISDGRARQMKFEATAARNAWAFLEKLAENVKPPEAGSTWRSHCEWAGEMLEVYLSRDLSETDGKATVWIDEFLAGLHSADSILPSTDLETFRRTVKEALSSPTGQLGPTGTGVFVSNLATASGMSFDAIWLVGMIEGAVPPAVRPDPLVPESGWQAAGGKPRTAQRVAKERVEYLSALASAPKRALSYPVADGSTQRQAYPSRWFLEQASALEGHQLYTGDLPSMRNRPWLTATESSEHALSGSADSALADRHDYVMRRLLQWRNGGRRMSTHPLVLDGLPARAITASRSRNLRRFTEFDGNLSETIDAADFQLGPSQSPVSATSLEAWATCPFRYFLGHMLRLSALETPEETTTISALERGTLLHDILEGFIRETAGSGKLPAPREEWGSESRTRLARITREQFQAAEQRGVTGRPLLWELAKQDILDDLETFLEEDANLRALHGTARILVEADFGSGNETPVVEDPESGLLFRGRIDRIDLTADGTSALVFDYKTGSAGPYEGLDKDVIDRGKRLQLGVYSMAARKFFSEAAEVRAAYWFTRTAARPRFAPSTFFNIDDTEASERFRQGVTSIIQGIGSGVFPANPGVWISHPERPGPENCRYCDFDSLCPARRGDLWERKKSDAALSSFLSLSVGGEEG